MRTAVLAALVTLAMGCAKELPAPTQQPKNSESAGTDAIALASDGVWFTEMVDSGLDGETYLATRVYEFPELDARFDIAVSCIAGNGVSELTIDSIIGDPKSPDERSAFLSAGLGPPLMAPVGRAKASDTAVTELKTYFGLDASYANRLKFNFNNPIAQGMIRGAPGYNDAAPTVEEGDVNYAKLLVAALPMTVEVENGAGSFELQIDQSSQVVAALTTCGADGPLLTDAYRQRATASEQQGRQETLQTLSDICLRRGHINESVVLRAFGGMRERSDAFLETAERLGIVLDCASSAPGALATFTAEIDAYAQRASESGIACNREALVQQAQEAGIDDSLWSANIQNYCSL